MRPEQLLYEREVFIVVHRCTRCGHTKRNRTTPEDDLSALL